MRRYVFGDIADTCDRYLESIIATPVSDSLASYALDIYKRKNVRSSKESLCALLELIKLLKNEGVDIKSLEIGKKESGKPYFKNADLHFSISHTHSYFAVAISDSRIGIDIEDKHLTLQRMESVKKKFFLDDEINYANTRDRFLEIWTYKEACAKMYDIPLTEAMKTCDRLNDVTNTKILKYKDATVLVAFE